MNQILHNTLHVALLWIVVVILVVIFFLGRYCFCNCLKRPEKPNSDFNPLIVILFVDYVPNCDYENIFLHIWCSSGCLWGSTICSLFSFKLNRYHAYKRINVQRVYLAGQMHRIRTWMDVAVSSERSKDTFVTLSCQISKVERILKFVSRGRVCPQMLDSFFITPSAANQNLSKKAASREVRCCPYIICLQKDLCFYVQTCK